MTTSYKDKITDFARLAIVFLASFVLVSCSGEGGGGGGVGSTLTPPPTAAGANEVSISGRAAKGTILNATVRATQIINGQISGTQKDVALGTNGDFSVSMPKGLVHLQVITQANSTTQDEATGVAVALPPEFKFRAAADLTDTTATTVSLNITPFSEAGVVLAEKSGGLTAANVNLANSGIANILGFDHLSTKPIQSSDAVGLASATENEKKLSVLNAAVSNMAATDALGCGVKAAYGQAIDCTVAKLADQFQMDSATTTQPIAAGVVVPAVLAQAAARVVRLGEIGYQALSAGTSIVANKVVALADAKVEMVLDGVASVVSAGTYTIGIGVNAVNAAGDILADAYIAAARQKSWADYRSGIVTGRDDYLIKTANDYYKYAVMSDLIYKDCKDPSKPNECYDPTDQWFNGRPTQPANDPLLLISRSFDGVKKEKGDSLNTHTAPGTYQILNWDTYGIQPKAANDVGLQWNAFYNDEEIVFVYRGTAGILEDLLMTDLAIVICTSPQHLVALDQFKAVVRHPAFNAHTGKKIVLTGHSLGGGIASYIAYKHQFDTRVSAIGFNPAPQCSTGGVVGEILNLISKPNNVIQLDIKGQFLRSAGIFPNLYFPVQTQNIFQYPNAYAIGMTNTFDSHAMAWMLFALDAAKSWCSSTSICTTVPAQLPIGQTPLVVNGISSTYTIGVSPYRPAILLSGSNLRAIDTISWACTQPNGAACTGSPYVWTPNNWTGKVDIFNDTSIKVYPGLLALGAATDTYNWTATFSALNSTPVSIPFSVTYQPPVATLPAPILSSPNGVTGVSTTPTFSWSTVPGADHYWLMVATSPSAFPTALNATSCPFCVSTGVSGNTNLTSHTLPNDFPIPGTSKTLSAGTTYYWRVQAWNTNGVAADTQGNYSATGSFTTAAAVAPSPVVPPTIPPVVPPVAPPTTDTTPPTVNAFTVNSSTVLQGQSFAINYTVSDSGGSGLKQIGLWRANVNGAANDPSVVRRN